MKTILITGANRGIGLEFCEQYLQANWTVFATCRDPQIATELHSLQQQFSPHLEIFALDLSETHLLISLDVH